jgi:hypothetical protein
MGIYAELRGFVLAHRSCGVLRGNRDDETPGEYRLRILCPCGARFERCFGPDDAEADVLRSALSVFEE